MTALYNVTTEHRGRFAILCALTVCSDPRWRQWAELWLCGEDRTKDSARAATLVARAVGAVGGDAVNFDALAKKAINGDDR